MEDRPIETFERCNIAEQGRPEGKEENEISLPSFPFLSFRSMTESNGRIIIICADLKYRKRIGIQRSRLYGMVKERIRKAKYARSSVARVEDRWSGIGMRSALSRNKGMLSACTGIGDENKNALEIYTCMCGRKRIRFEDRQKETKRRTRWISQKDPYIYIYRIYSAKVAMSSRPIGFPGTRYNKRLVVSFVRVLPVRRTHFLPFGICSVSGQERFVLRGRPRRGDRVDRFRPTDR